MVCACLILGAATGVPSPCPQIDAGTFDLLVDRAILSIEAGETRTQTIKALRDWCKSFSIHLDSDQLACLRRHVRELRKRLEQELQIASVCEASSLATLRSGFEAAKTRGESRSKSLGATLRSLFPQAMFEKPDDEWVALGKQLVCRFAVVEFVFGPPAAQRAVSYGKDTYKELRIPKGLRKRFRSIAKGSCGGPDGLNAAANLAGVFGDREPPDFSYDEIKGFTFALSLLGSQPFHDLNTDKSWEVIASNLECQFALVALAKEIEDVRPPPTTAGAFDLRVGVTYLVPKEIPLMPTHNPKGLDQVAAALAGMRIVPVGGRIKVLSIVLKIAPPPWYQVEAWDARHRQMGKGWINGQALLGLLLKVE